MDSAQGGAARRGRARGLPVGGRLQLDPGRHQPAVTVIDDDAPAVAGRNLPCIVRQHDDFAADDDAVVKIDHVGILQADAAAGNVFADRRRIVGAVDAVVGIFASVIRLIRARRTHHDVPDTTEI